MKKRYILTLIPVLGAAALFTACGEKSYADGTYTAKSSVYESVDEESEDEGGNGYGIVTITIKDNVIIACEFETYELDGTLKDEDYGKKRGEIANADFYNKAQKAVAGSHNYAEQLAAKGSLSEVDAVSGATISYGQFKEAVKAALKQAEQ